MVTVPEALFYDNATRRRRVAHRAGDEGRWWAGLSELSDERGLTWFVVLAQKINCPVRC